MSSSSVSDLDAAGTGALSSKFPLLRFFSMSPLQHPTPLSSPTMPPSSRSEKLLRDALLRDERERQQLSTPLGTNNNSTTPLTHKASTHRRRHSHAPTSSKEDYTRGSFLFRTAMNNPRSPSPSPSSFSQGQELERDGEDLPVRRKLFYGGDAEGNDGPQSHPRQSRGHAYQQHHQQSTMGYHARRSSLSTSPSPSRHSSASSSPSPSPLCMKRHQEGLGPTSPNTHTHYTTTVGPIANANTLSSVGKTSITSSRYGPAYPSQPKSLSHGQGEPLQMTPHEHEQALRVRLERALSANGGSDSRSRIMTRGRDELKGNGVGGEQGEHWLWSSGRQFIGSGNNGSGSISASINTLNTVSSSGSTSFSNASSKYPRTQTRTQQPTGYSVSPSHTRTRSQTDPNLHLPIAHPTSDPNSNSPRRNTVTPTTSPALNTFGSGKLTRSDSISTKKSGVIPPLPVLPRGAGNGGEEEGSRLLTPPPTPPTPPTLPFMTRVPPGSGGAGANGYVPSPSGTPTRIPVSIQTQNIQRKKEGGLEMRRPTQGPAAAGGHNEKRQPGGQRQRDVTVTQARLATTTSPNLDSKRGRSSTSTESFSTMTSVSSATSNSHVGCVSSSRYCACSSHSSLDGPLGSPQPPFVGGVYQSQSNPSPPSSPNTTTKPFNARKASTQCRAIEGYVSFASVEGLGEPPLVGDELDSFGEVDDGGKGRTGIPFLPLGAWTALGWKKFLGGGGAGIEVSDQNASHTRAAICIPT